MYMIGAAATGVFGFIYFAMLNIASEPIIFVAIILSLIPHDMLYGPQAALIATWLFGTYRSAFAIAVYIAICAVISLVATALMSDYTGMDISDEYQSR